MEQSITDAMTPQQFLHHLGVHSEENITAVMAILYCRITAQQAEAEIAAIIGQERSKKLMRWFGV